MPGKKISNYSLSNNLFWKIRKTQISKKTQNSREKEITRLLFAGNFVFIFLSA